MTYRELLRLYKQGKLEDSAKKQIEAEIEKQDAISEFLYEEGERPDFSDLENEQGCFNGLNDETQKTERQNSKNDNSIEEQQRNQPEKQEEAFNEQFMKEIRHSIRKAFIKMGTIVGAVVLIFVLCAVFILPKAVSKFYYDPNEAAGAYEGMTTTRMSLDLSVYSELYLPGNYRDQVNAVSRGYGEYDIVIPQTYTWTGKFTSVSGRLVRGKLTLYDNNILSRPTLMFYLPGDENAWEAWETDENGKETKVDICIRGINSNVVKALETSAKKHDLSREEYLRQCLERIAYDDRALGSKYEQQLQKLFQCLEGQQKQLSLLIAGMEQVEESCCRLEDGLLEKESWSEESEGAIV